MSPCQIHFPSSWDRVMNLGAFICKRVMDFLDHLYGPLAHISSGLLQTSLGVIYCCLPQLIMTFIVLMQAKELHKGVILIELLHYMPIYLTGLVNMAGNLIDHEHITNDLRKRTSQKESSPVPWCTWGHGWRLPLCTHILASQCCDPNFSHCSHFHPLLLNSNCLYGEHPGSWWPI